MSEAQGEATQETEQQQGKTDWLPIICVCLSSLATFVNDTLRGMIACTVVCVR